MNDADTEAPQAFEDSRRLTGANRWFGAPAVVLTALTAAACDDGALAAWAQRVRRLCAALGWPDPQPHVQRHAAHTSLAFVAPDDLLFTATEVNEWAWERSAAEQGALNTARSADGAAQAAARTAARVILPTQLATDDLEMLTPEFSGRSAQERSLPLQRLKAAAAWHGLPLFEDDDSVSIGAGSGSRTWPRAALPLPMDVPWHALHDVPTLLVTGSNGKTTTTRLLAAMAAQAGLTAGLCSTEGVLVGGQTVQQGDYAGPAGARAVLRHRGVDLAVLETARGGLLRRGLALRHADAALVTNVSADHLGEYGVDSVDDIAHTKLVVAHALAQHADGMGEGSEGSADGVPSGSLVLNGADAALMHAAAHAPHVLALRASGRLALFAADWRHPALAAWRQSGGSTCGVHQGRLLLGAARGAGPSTPDEDLGDIAAMPLTLNGAAGHNIENIAAAVLTARAAGLPLAAIQRTLWQFGSRPQDNPGRLERWRHRGATVLVDYAHNPDGLAQLLRVARALKPQRLGLLLGQAGNRDDTAIGDLARAAAGFAPDRVVIKELPGMLRGRPPGSVPALLHTALLAAGLPVACVDRMPDEEAAARSLLAWAQPGDVVVLPVHTREVRQRLADVLQQP